LITPEDVMRRIETCFAGGQIRFLNAKEAAIACRATPRRQTQPRRVRPAAPPATTICALTYGNHLPLIRLCLEGIRRHCRRADYRLVVGANEPSPRTLRYLLRLRREGFIDRLHLSPVNLNKLPMMRRMFQGGLDTEFVWWFDDDCHVTSRDALPRRLDFARASPPRTVAWGHRFFVNHEDEFDCGYDVRAWIRAARWFRGKPLPSWGRPWPAGHAALRETGREPADGRWYFLTGGSWFARVSALQELDWPDPRLVMQAEDILMGEAIRQQDWEIMDIGTCGVRMPPVPSRGQDKRETMLDQMARIAD
jgi:hypothetical protein